VYGICARSKMEASFVGFAIRRIGESQDKSMDDLYLTWRRQVRQEEIAADVSAAFEDQAAGRGIPMVDVFLSVRQILDGTKT
jgi:hypothetical protein